MDEEVEKQVSELEEFLIHDMEEPTFEEDLRDKLIMYNTCLS